MLSYEVKSSHANAYDAISFEKEYSQGLYEKKNTHRVMEDYSSLTLHCEPSLVLSMLLPNQDQVGKVPSQVHANDQEYKNISYVVQKGYIM